MYRSTQVHRSMVPLADTSASGVHNNGLEIGRHLCDTYSVDMLLSPDDFSLMYSKGGAM